jgi:hypothetical protein
MTAPSKMTNNELYQALKKAKIDCANQGTARAKVNEHNKFLNERNVKLEKEKSTSKAAYSRVYDCNYRMSLVANEHQKIIKELTDKLTAADQQSAEYKSMAEHCGAGEIRELEVKCAKLESESLSLASYGYSDIIDSQNEAIKDLQSKIKCLKDSLAGYQNTSEISGYVHIDDIEADADARSEWTTLPTDASKEIKRLESEIVELKGMATVADYDALKGDFALLSRAFNEQGVLLYTSQELVTGINEVHGGENDSI